MKLTKLCRLVLAAGLFATPSLGRAQPADTSDAIAAALAAKTRLLAAGQAFESKAAEQQLAVILTILKTNAAARAELAKPTELTPGRSKLLTGYGAIQQNALLRDAWLHQREALYGAESVALVTGAFDRLRLSGTNYLAEGRKLRAELAASGKLAEAQQMWRNLQGCYVHRATQSNGKEAWVWSGVSPRWYEAVFGANSPGGVR